LPNEPLWLPVEVVIDINIREVGETNEPFGANLDLLGSAMMRPQALWHYEGQDDMAVLATVLLFGIARNHPFRQGNKRTALTAAEVFLNANGYELTAPDSDLLAEAIIGVIEGEASEEDFTDIMRVFVLPLEEP
jgi:death on curing protein